MKTVSGNPIVISDAKEGPVEELKVSFEPSQSFNGYDGAWSGGTGKNMVGTGNVSWGYSLGSDGSVMSYLENRCITPDKIPIDNTKTYVFSTQSNDIWLLYCVYNGNTLIRRMSAIPSGSIINVSGGNYIRFAFYSLNPDASVTSRYDYRKVEPELDKIQIEVASTPTAYEPYENICPIYGTTGSSVTRYGKNYVPKLDHSMTSHGVTITPYPNGTISINGTSTQEVDIILVTKTPPGRYYFSGAPAGNGNVLITMYNFDEYPTIHRAKQWDGETNCVYDNGSSLNNEFLAENAGSIYAMMARIRGGYSYNNVVIDPMLRNPEEDRTVTVEFASAGTVYGGTINFTTGELIVNMLEITCGESIAPLINNRVDTGGYANSTASPGSVYFETGWTSGNPSLFKYACDSSIYEKGLSDSRVFVNQQWSSGMYATSETDNRYPYPDGTPMRYLRFSVPIESSTLADKRAFLKDHPIKIVYPLKNPWTYQLTSDNLSLLEKDNTIKTDYGSITITYDEIDRFLEYDSEFIYLLSCLAGEEEFEEEFTLSELSARATDILYAYIIEDEPPIYYDPLESRFEKLLRVKCGFKNKTDYDDKFWSSNFSRAETLLYLSINGETPEDTWEARSKVEQLLYEWLFS